MKKPTIQVCAVLLTALLSIGSVQAKSEKYQIDPEHFSIGFLIEHVGYADLLGMFLEGKGSFTFDDETNAVSAGRVEIASDSVFTNHEKRDEHVRSDEFLGTDRYPDIVFVVSKYQADGEGSGQLKGDLTLLGQTHPVTLDVTINKRARYPFGHRQHTLGISARTTIKRSRWGMSYGIANGLVGDAVDLILEFEAVRQ